MEKIWGSGKPEIINEVSNKESEKFLNLLD
jgi:hypothetical protein